tara:strand:+ start:21 stop:392 length:372 start_codon:yes stop_codon:yes gene_type:complete
MPNCWKIVKFEDRPWGSFELLIDKPSYKVKRIIVKNGKRLSLQYHNKRDKNWVIVQGKACVQLDRDGENCKIFERGESLYISRLTPHRVSCQSEEDLIFIETQTGEYFGEDDIVRLEDDYSRQ